MASKREQLNDLGLARRLEITTADDKRDPYAAYTEKDLQILRKSVQNSQTTRLQTENKPVLDAWSKFHKKVQLEEGEFTDEPQLLNGQSHRAHLHHEMRQKEGFKSRQFAPSNHVSAGRTKHLDPALDPAKFSAVKNNLPTPKPAMTRPTPKKPKEEPKSGNRKGVKVRRRAIRSPSKGVVRRTPQNFEVKLADPESWLNSVRNKAGQSDASALHSASETETLSTTESDKESHSVATMPVKAGQTVSTTQASAAIKSNAEISTSAVSRPPATIQPSGNTKIAATPPRVGSAKSVRAMKIDMATRATTATTVVARPSTAARPDVIVKPSEPAEASQLENPFFASNLPRPLTNSSTPLAQPKLATDETLLLSFDSPPKNTGPDLVDISSKLEQMDLDDNESEPMHNTAAVSMRECKLAWIQELGFVNDAIADLHLSDPKQVKQLEDRRKQLQNMIHAASNQNLIKLHQKSPRPERLVELSPTPLQKAVTARPFVPSPTPATAPVTAGLQASRWADPDVEKASSSKQSPKGKFKAKEVANKSNESVDYWQKTLPKLRPLPAGSEKDDESSASTNRTSQKPTKSIYESRYAC